MVFFGILWIDGDHSYEGVFSDYTNWLPFVVDGGVIAFHDNNSDGVARLIQEIKSKGMLTLTEEIESITCFKLERGKNDA